MKWLIAAFWVSALVSSHASQPPSPGTTVVGQQEQQQGAQEGSRSNNQSPDGAASAPVTPQGDPNRSAPQQESPGENSNAPWEWGTVADWAIVAFTAVLTVFTALQILQNRRTRMLTQELERARFAVENRKIEQLDGGKVRIEYEVVNRGRSVAKILRSANQTLFLSAVPQPPLDLDWDSTPEIVQAGDNVVRENQIHSLPPPEIQALAARTSFITIMGGLEYVDIFGKTHVRRFAFMWDGEGRFVPPHGDATGYNDEN